MNIYTEKKILNVYFYAIYLSCNGSHSCIICCLSLQCVGSRVQSQWLRHMGLVALLHVGSSQIREWTHVSCIGGLVFFFHHWATRKSSLPLIFKVLCSFYISFEALEFSELKTCQFNYLLKYPLHLSKTEIIFSQNDITQTSLFSNHSYLNNDHYFHFLLMYMKN